MYIAGVLILSMKMKMRACVSACVCTCVHKMSFFSQLLFANAFRLFRYETPFRTKSHIEVSNFATMISEYAFFLA